MIRQIAAKTDIFKKVEILKEIQTIKIEHQRKKVIKKFRDSKINKQAEDLIR
jgi:hypothetical protein